jgi:uncharacterized lipoprotein NlpE involved in copper resistance
LASCQSKANKAAEAQADSLALAMTPITELTEVYEGTLPAADGPGIDYVLTLNAATDGVDTAYTLDMTYSMLKVKDKTRLSLQKENSRLYTR